MKVAANVVGAASWLSLLAALWYQAVTGNLSVAWLIAIIIVSMLSGLGVTQFLYNMDSRSEQAAEPPRPDANLPARPSRKKE